MDMIQVGKDRLSTRLIIFYATTKASFDYQTGEGRPGICPVPKTIAKYF